MDANDTAAKAALFQRLHLGPEILVIANAWDAASARVFEQAGIRAVGTGSAGVAFSHGYRDDEFIPRDVMLRAIGEMVRAVDVPVTADILSGLGDTPEAVAATIREVIALGASGVNIEDGTDIGGRTWSTSSCTATRSAPPARRRATPASTSSSTPAPTATG
jgi:2-methylisocitrate lyase-like PEP mutase family enzyme